MFPERIVRPRDKSGDLSNPLKPWMIVATVGIALSIPELFTIDRRVIFIPVIRDALSTLFVVFYFRKSIFAWHVGLISFVTAIVLQLCGYVMGVRLFRLTTFSSIAWPIAGVISFLWLLALRKPYADYLSSAAVHNLER